MPPSRGPSKIAAGPTNVNIALDEEELGRKTPPMKTSHILAAASLAALITLAACNKEPEVIGGPVDPQAEALKNAPPVELPPSITASRTYRCADNSLVYIDFFSNDSAAVRTSENGERHRLAAAEGGAFEAEGYSVSANAETIQYKAPGKSEQRCRA
jgi:hypothetical protein